MKTNNKIDVSGFLKMEDEECIKNTKQTTKHTSSELNIVENKHGYEIQNDGGFYIGHARKESDAVLFSSAPLMLEALELAHDFIDGIENYNDEAHAAMLEIKRALKKAKGE